MVLAVKNPSAHNRVIGRRIPHPTSTNFNEDSASLPAKRVKRGESFESIESTESALRRTPSADDEISRSCSPSKAMPREIKDSDEEDEDGEDIVPRSSQTDLESTLPQTRTDKEAIEEYETMHAQDRMKSRKWSKGKSSIYVDAFNLALDTVLEEEGELFDDAELSVFDNWRNLSYEAQYLYVCLVIV